MHSESRVPFRRCVLLVWLFLLALAPALRAAESHGFRVPDGFEVSLYADDSLAHDIYSMTIDSHGRVVVASAGWIKILHDTQSAGKADKATVFANFPKTGARGMYFDGNDLICTGENGVRRLHDRNGDGVWDGDADVLLRTERDGEHAANGVIKGPDGWLYMICGNDAGASKAHVTRASSPVKDPNCGAVIRIAPDGKSSEVVAHGFRNPYNCDFNALGNLFTYDADGERDHHLPWYSGTRIFDIAQGMHHGWVLRGFQHAWNRPPAWFDNVERLWEVGRGSPTGVTVYRHHGFPARYREGLFTACWTYGRIYFFPLTRRGSTYDTKLEIFMETAGDVGFAPTGIAVGPDGDLFVSIGGRGTAGSVFRVRYAGKTTPPKPDSTLREVLAAPQPLASWSRAKWVPLAQELGREPFEKAVSDARLPLAERIRALEVLVEVFGRVSLEVARNAAASPQAELAARAVWAVSRSGDNPASRRFIAQMTHSVIHSGDDRVQRAVWEALATLPTPLETDVQIGWSGGGSGVGGNDRRVNAAAALTASGPGRESFVRHVEGRDVAPDAVSRMADFLPGVFDPKFVPSQSNLVQTCVDAFLAVDPQVVRVRLDAVRLLQLALGDVKLVQDKPDTYDGFVGANTEQVPVEARRIAVAKLAPAFPTQHRDLDRELGRLLGMLSAEDPALLARVSALWTDYSPVEDDIHYLIMLARLPGARTAEVTRRTAHAVAALQVKMAADKKEPSRFWPVRVGDVFDRLRQRDPALAAALVADAAFGQPDHTLYAGKLAGAEKAAATRRLVAAANEREKSDRNAWTPELAALVASLPETEALPVLRAHWELVPLQDTILPVLARAPQAVDRERFVRALHSLTPATVERAATALTALEARGDAAELAVALGALRRLCSATKEKPAREALAKLLVHWSAQDIAVKEDKDVLAAYAPWFAWFAKTHPAESAKLSGEDDADFAAWKKRLATVDWTRGDEERGRRVWEERACVRCHGGSARLGPDLTGVAQRLSREDLFTAMIDPNRDVSAAYYTKTLVTKSGNTYTGFLIYDSPTAKLVQTGPDTTVRLTGDDVVEMRTSQTSLMPAGLLNGLKDEELADFYAFLKTLRKK